MRKQYKATFQSEKPNSLNGKKGIAWEDDTPGEINEGLWLFLENDNQGTAWCCSREDLVLGKEVIK